VQSLGWGNLDFILRAGKYAPAKDITFNVQTSGGYRGAPRRVHDLAGFAPRPDLHVVQ
jgi:hypothetical protein